MGRQQVEELLSEQEILSATTQQQYQQLAQEMLRVTDLTELRELLGFYPHIQIKAMIEALPALQLNFHS